MNILLITLMATSLHRSPYWVAKIYQEGEQFNGLLCVALVERESQFNPRAQRIYPDGSSDWGLFQLNSRYHKQYRNNVDKHIEAGANFLLGLIIKYSHTSVINALSTYNTGKPFGRKGEQYALEVLQNYWKLQDDLCLKLTSSQRGVQETGLSNVDVVGLSPFMPKN